MIPFADVNLWLSTALWVAVSALALRDAAAEWRETRKEYLEALPFGNGKALVGRYRYRIATWFLVAFSLATVIGIIAVLGNIFAMPEQADTTLVSAILRYLLDFTLYAFWRAKRGNRAMRREVERRQKSVEAALHAIQCKTEEVDDKVTEIHDEMLGGENE